MDYMHRIPFNMVDTIVVDGMVEVKTISFQDPVCVPYRTTMYGGMWAGKNIVIQGLVNPQASRFEINLGHKDGIAFHYNLRFDQNKVVCNTKSMDEWGLEERSGEIPFEKGQNFHISVNGIHVMDYMHRIPFNMVDTIVVDGMVEVKTISFQDPVCVPYKTTMYGGMWAGKKIVTQGLVNPQASSTASPTCGRLMLWRCLVT
ncbi:galectin-9-like [Hemibagrus wyckioides]|uniref:galectin-9-like n=1 Tax=Hemibagrus wyckioides TaxID=337641 RepID=UPI00266B7F0E|nr:galectin-9-like [Hemibagrus wyckioides]